MMEIEYICHPVSGNVADNIADIRRVLRKRHTVERLPFAPYLLALQYLRDDVPEERELGMRANEEFFRNGTIDSVYVCGKKVSNGMRREISLAYDLGIPLEVEQHLRNEVQNILPFHLSYIGQRCLISGNSVVVTVDMLSKDLIAYEAAEPPRNKEEYDAGIRGIPISYEEFYDFDWSGFRHHRDQLLDRITSLWSSESISHGFS